MTTRTTQAAVALTIGLLAGCARDENGRDPHAPQAVKGRITVDSAQRTRFKIETVVLAQFNPSILTTGTVAFSADRSTAVLAPISGPVSRILVEPGARVERGQPLAIVTSPDFAAAIASYRKAEVAARNSQRIADLDEQLFKNDALARRELEQAQSDAASAAADREAALAELRSLGIDSLGGAGSRSAIAEGVIRAPIAGTVVEKLISPGQLLQAGQTSCFTIADLSVVWVMANVFERDIRSVKRGQRVLVTTDATPDSLSGVVDYVAALVDPATKATGVRLVVPNQAQILKRDMLVQVMIRGTAPRKGLLVAVTAVLRDDENLPYLFVAMADGSFARRRIELGGRVEARYEIMTGLAAGERVVVDGSLYLQALDDQ